MGMRMSQQVKFCARPTLKSQLQGLRWIWRGCKGVCELDEVVSGSDGVALLAGFGYSIRAITLAYAVCTHTRKHTHNILDT